MISFLLVATSFVGAAGNQPDKERVFLEFKGKPDSSVVEMAGGRVLYDYELLGNVIVVEVPVLALKGILNNPKIIGWEFDATVSAMAPPGACSPWPECKGSEEPDPTPDPEPSQEIPWGVDKIDADLTSATGQGVKVCVVDTGIDEDHPDLQANIVGGKNFVGRRIIDPTKWDDDNGHGTHVAGTIAAVDNSVGVVGVAPEASLLAAKVLDRKGNGYVSDVIAGIDYCVSAGANVVSMSLSADVHIQTMKDAVDVASQSVILVAAAGNDGSSVDYPAAYDSVIAVGATDSGDNLAYFSNVGPEIELVAPGVNILSTWKNGEFNTISGTSMATPHVSGVAALALETNPSMTNAQIRSLLQTTADDLGATGRDDNFGYGLVDAELI